MDFILSSTLFILRVIRYIDNTTNNSNLQFTLLTRVLINYNAINYIMDGIKYISSQKYIEYVENENENIPSLNFDDNDTELIDNEEVHGPN